MKKESYSFMQVALTVLFVSAFLISNVVTSRQVALPFGLSISGGIFIFPITYILSDVFSEVYGYKWSRVTCYLAFAMNLLMSLIFTLVISVPAPSYFTSQAAFETVLGNSPRVLFASLLAYVMGDLANDRVFAKMKAKHENEITGFGARAILSSLVGELSDSLIFVPIAFLGTMPVSSLLTMIVTQVLLKTSYEVIILPITTLVAKKLTVYEKAINA